MLNGNNPVRRDVTMLPAAGWLLLAFKTDNPGAWLYVPPRRAVCVKEYFS